MTAAGAVMSLNVTGDKALTVSALNADVTTIDASGMDIGGSFVQTGRSNTGIQTATGSGGDDTFIMANKADALAAGAGADTLDINDAVILGGVAVDLAAADQVVSYNGSANAAVQSGFQNVDLSGYTGDFGSEVNGDAKANTITGTCDEITGGLGGDTITGGAGADVIDLSVDSGADNVRYVASTGGIDTVTNFDTTEDTLTLTAISGIGASTKAVALAANAAITSGVDGTVYIFADGTNGAGSSGDDLSALTGGYTNMTSVAAWLELGIAATDAHDYVAVVNDDAGTHYVYHIDVDAVGSDNTIAAGDVTYLGTVTEESGSLIVVGDIA